MRRMLWKSRFSYEPWNEYGGINITGFYWVYIFFGFVFNIFYIN